MFVWIAGLSRKQQPSPAPVGSHAQLLGGLAQSSRLTPEQALRLGQFALQFLH